MMEGTTAVQIYLSAKTASTVGGSPTLRWDV